jgi:hypothetical protein
VLNVDISDCSAWPPLSSTTQHASEIPFTISVSDTQLSILQQKLALATLSDKLPDSGWDYGVPLADIQHLLNYWRDKYDWRKHEAEINRKMPQFTRDIEVDGGFGKLNVHYVHKKSEVKSAVPLLVIHGCECSDVCLVPNLRTRVQGQEVSLKYARFFHYWLKHPQNIQASMWLQSVYLGLGSHQCLPRRASP